MEQLLQQQTLPKGLNPKSIVTTSSETNNPNNPDSAKDTAGRSISDDVGSQVLTCNTDKYRIEIKKQGNQYRYIFRAANNSEILVVLTNGKYYNNGKTGDSGGESYTFRNGSYEYIIGKISMGGAFHTVKQNGMELRNEPCN